MLPIPTLHPLVDAAGRTSWTNPLLKSAAVCTGWMPTKNHAWIHEIHPVSSQHSPFVWGILYSQPKNPWDIQAWPPELQADLAGTALVVFICAVAALAVTAQQPYPELPEVFPLRGWKLRESRRVLMQTLEVKRLLPLETNRWCAMDFCDFDDSIFLFGSCFVRISCCQRRINEFREWLLGLFFVIVEFGDCSCPASLSHWSKGLPAEN